MALTLNEARERAQIIWGLVKGLKPRAHKDGEWFVETPDNIGHYLDGNGHADCHKECATLEDAATAQKPVENSAPTFPLIRNNMTLVRDWKGAVERMNESGSNVALVPKDLSARISGVIGHYIDQSPEDQHIFIVVGPNVWGRGYTREQAHVAAGKPTQYLVYACTDPWAYIDELGYICRQYESEYWEVARVEPKKKAVKRG